MSDEVYELQIGYHVSRNIPYQRLICDTDFTNPYYEVNNNGKVEYTKTQPKHHLQKVEDACKNTNLILQVAKLNHEQDNMVATIRDGEIITGEDIDIWNDIKVWNNGKFPKHQSDRLVYKKYSYHNKYLKSGVNEIKMRTDKLYHNGDVLHFSVDSSTFQDHYTVHILGYDRLAWESSDGIHGNYHGYRYFDTFEEVQDWFEGEYGVRLVKSGGTVYYWH